MSLRPRLILVAASIMPGSASEPGKGFVWAEALATIYSIHVLTTPGYARQSRRALADRGIEVHAVGQDVDYSTRLRTYRGYAAWCRAMLPECANLLSTCDAIGVHHITIGSFRVLPRYDRLGCGYTLGPLGGGETAPAALLFRSRLPRLAIAAECSRILLNQAAAFAYAPRCVFSASRLALSTTTESETILKRLGAKHTAVVFPDAIVEVDAGRAFSHRREQVSEMRAAVRLIFSGRAVWWKGLHLALLVLAASRDAGARVILDVCAEGPALDGVKQLATKLDVADQTSFRGFLNRIELQRAYRDSHAIILPSMHESSSSALLESYACGLPSLTLGIGGTATIASDASGFNRRCSSETAWIQGAVDQIVTWQTAPERWLACSQAAVARAADFTTAKLAQRLANILPIDLYSRNQRDSQRTRNAT